MPTDDELRAELRRLSGHLDEQSVPVDPNRAMTTSPRRGPSRLRRPLVATALALAAVVAVVAIVQIPHDDSPRALQTGNDASTSTSRVAGYEGAGFSELPLTGVATIAGREVTLLSLDGTVLGRFHQASLPDQPNLPATLSVGPSLHLSFETPASVPAPEGCDGGAESATLRVVLCGGQPQLRTEVATVVDGTATRLTGVAPGSADAGHWAYALPSPDGRWVLGQWSGECETPRSYLMAVPAGTVRSVDGSTDAASSLESQALGWTSDGQAIVALPEGACGPGDDRPGVYLVDPSTGARTFVGELSSASTVAMVWNRVNDPSCPDGEVARADVNGDEQADIVFDEGVEDHSLGVCTTTGTTSAIDGLGVAGTEVVRPIDVEPDGRAEILYGGTTASAVFSKLAVYVDGSLTTVTTKDGPLDLADGMVEAVDADSGQTAAVGCEDMAGDAVRELVQVRVDFTAAGVSWTKTAYRISGATADVVGTDAGDAATPSAPLEYAATLTQPCDAPAAAPVCGSGTTSPATYDPEHGTYAVTISSVDVEAREVTVDIVQWLSGPDAVTAYHRDHPDDPEGPPNDYYVVNESQEQRTIPIDPYARVDVVQLDVPGGPQLAPAALEDLPDHLTSSPFRYAWMAVDHNRVTGLCEQYTP